MALNKVLEGMLNDFKKDFLLEIPEISKQFEYLVNYLVVSKFIQMLLVIKVIWKEWL